MNCLGDRVLDQREENEAEKLSSSYEDLGVRSRTRPGPRVCSMPHPTGSELQ